MIARKKRLIGFASHWSLFNATSTLEYTALRLHLLL